MKPNKPNKPDKPINALFQLLALSGASGDEGAVADWVAREAGQIPGVQLTRVGDNVIAVKSATGETAIPPVAIFAHLDTTGFTLGYHDKLLPIGGPAPKNGDKLRCGDLRGRIRIGDKRGPHGQPDWTLYRVRSPKNEKASPLPGTRWIYDRTPKIKNGVITAPYLDNRAGVLVCVARFGARSPYRRRVFHGRRDARARGAGVRRLFVPNAWRHASLDFRFNMAHQRYAHWKRRGYFAPRWNLSAPSVS